jgi:hypothetical protein
MHVQVRDGHAERLSQQRRPVALGVAAGAHEHPSAAAVDRSERPGGVWVGDLAEVELAPPYDLGQVG